MGADPMDVPHVPLKQKEKEYIEHILVAAGGDKAKAADALKVNLSTLYRKLSDDPKEG